MRVENTPNATIPSQAFIALRMFVMAAAAIAIATCLLYLVNALRWRSQPFLGALYAYTLVVDGNQTFGDEQWAALAAGIQRLDQIVQINDTPLFEQTDPLASDFRAWSFADYTRARETLKAQTRALNIGDEIRLDVLRPEPQLGATTPPTCSAPQNGFARCSITYTLAPLGDSDFITYFLFPFITSVIALVVGGTVLYYKHKNTNALLIALFCVALGVFSSGAFNNSTTHMLIPLWLIFTALGGTSALVLALTFPTQLTMAQRYPVLLAVPPVAALALMLIDLNIFYNPPQPFSFTLVWQLPVGLAVVSFVVLCGGYVLRRRYATSAIARDQINTSLIGLGLAVIPVILWMLSTFGLQLPFNSATIMPFFVAIPISLAYAVMQYRAYDSDRVLTQSITYGILLGALVFGYFALVAGFSFLIGEYLNPNNPFIVAATIFIIAVAFLPVRTRLQSEIDKIYFRTRWQYQTQVELFTREISTSRDFNEILQRYINSLKQILSARGIFIFLPDEEKAYYVSHQLSQPATDVRFAVNSTFIHHLQETAHPIRISAQQAWERALLSEKARLNMLQTQVIVPLRGGREGLNGFVILGKPQQARGEYTYEELRFLENISAQMAISVERAQVVESLERRVRELGVLSQVSQAVNFAVEFDDLLELISAQTQKVIEATHFYITLKDLHANQMYYAFFLEFNERIREEENHRWMATNDLYSLIVQSGQAQRHDDYLLAVKAQNAHPRAVSEDVKAWMGVPLVAGSNRLGVIAVGTSRSNYTYSDEQLKIFGDIGALAATSLDKARLFEETNLRARQLRALNDISRSLQAERDVERLTRLITSSAVEILNAEAGSLLLTAEDYSGDLEFRIVVGGSGEGLVGTRVKAGQGLVGEVAAKGKTVIVNNTQEDSRWQGEVAKDGSFSTNAVLAVPLMANNVVIGVLEVLNKKDGSVYVKEDADVLETFAGQAAIAIENARLFQKTDEQLSARVQELETLEKIDAELNRALDLERVASITVKWAIANTGATAGLLGIINEADTPRLEILHTYGYTEQDYPVGAEDKSWPLDKGIVSRVMRTKRADVVTDTSIDLDYIPSLRKAKSQLTVPMIAGGEIIAILILEKNVNPPLSLLDLAFVQRLTDHATIALENARLYDELQYTNKSQSRYMGVGAHELKNALTPIKSWTEFLLTGYLGEINDQQANSLTVIKNNVGRAELIIQDLRDFAKMRAHELKVSPEPTSFRNIVIETLRTFTQQIEEKEQTLVNNVAEDLPLIMGDSPRLIQVMTNFVSNANKYSPNGATITLDARVERGRKSKQGKVLGDFLVISVADTGMGISKEDQKRMFQPYFRTERAQASDIPGTGLGMSLTRELIVQHGGEVWIESEVDVGSTFYFTVPLAPMPEPSSD